MSEPLSEAREPGVKAPLLSPDVAAWLLPLEVTGSGRKTSARRVGGKAASLGRLLREGFLVPRGWVIDAKFFAKEVEGILPRGHDLATLVKIAHTKAGVDRAARARDRVLAMTLPDALSRALESIWSQSEATAPWGFAVRSSATCEDTNETSFAGLAATVLGARGPREIGEAVKRVWASAFLPRAVEYMAASGVRDVGMAVVLQHMIEAEAAGVLFTAPPPALGGPHWREDERLVNVTFGLGAPVVEGVSAVDTIRISKEGRPPVTSIADKRRALIVGPRGLEEIELDAEKARSPALGRRALEALGETATRLEEASLKIFGEAATLDVEFAVERAAKGETPRIWVLQARPITGGGFPEGGDAETVWSRANVGEALPGPATPLTWSIARAFSNRGFEEAFDALGCKVPRGTRIVGDVNGRFYLNLTTFMQIAAQVPGLTPRALLTASGGASDAVITALERQARGVSKRGFLTRLPFTAPREIARQARLGALVDAFDATARRSRDSLLDMDLGILPDDGLATTLKGAVELLEKTGALMLSCASASLASHLALCSVLERTARRRPSARGPADDSSHVEGAPGSGWGAAEPMAEALLGGARELDSANPGIALASVGDVFRTDPSASDALLVRGARTLAEIPEGPGRRAFEEFLSAYGDRAVREAELATPRWREEPGPVLAMLSSSLKAPASDAEASLGRARAIADRELARLEMHVSAIELAAIRGLVERTQHFTRLRERMRTWVTRVLGMIRAIALDVDRRLRRIDPSVTAGGVFFCTYEELVTALRSGRAEVGHVVRLRRAEHARDAARPDPPSTFIGRPPPLVLPPAPGGRLHGLPASSGVVEGRARVLPPGVFGLDAVEAGEILISRTTDVGLSPLFLVAAAVVTELGGPLSHAAVVAREYGIPAVVNVTGATLAIRTGDLIRVDGDRGIVDLLDERSQPRGNRAERVSKPTGAPTVG